MTVEDVLSLAKGYYLENATGGNLHVVLDDGNLEFSHIEFCRGEALKNDDPTGIKICNMLFRLNEAQRQEVYERLHSEPFHLGAVLMDKKEVEKTRKNYFERFKQWFS